MSANLLRGEEKECRNVEAGKKISELCLIVSLSIGIPDYIDMIPLSTTKAFATIESIAQFIELFEFLIYVYS